MPQGVGRRETKGKQGIPTRTHAHAHTLANGRWNGKRETNCPRDVGYHPSRGTWPQGEIKPIPMRWTIQPSPRVKPSIRSPSQQIGKKLVFIHPSVILLRWRILPRVGSWAPSPLDDAPCPSYQRIQRCGAYSFPSSMLPPTLPSPLQPSVTTHPRHYGGAIATDGNAFANVGIVIPREESAYANEWVGRTPEHNVFVNQRGPTVRKGNPLASDGCAHANQHGASTEHERGGLLPPIGCAFTRQQDDWDAMGWCHGWSNTCHHCIRIRTWRMPSRRDGRPCLALRRVDAQLGHDVPDADVGGATWRTGGTEARAWTATKPSEPRPRTRATNESTSTTNEGRFFRDVMRSVEHVDGNTRSFEAQARAIAKDGGVAAAMANAGVLAAMDAGCVLRTTLASVHVAWLDEEQPSTIVKDFDGTEKPTRPSQGRRRTVHNKPLVVDPDLEECQRPKQWAEATFAFDVARRRAPRKGSEEEEEEEDVRRVKLCVAHHVGEIEDHELVHALRVAQQASQMYGEAMRAAVASKMDPTRSTASTGNMQET